MEMADFISRWAEIQEDKDLMSQIRQGIDQKGLCFFFLSPDGVFGGPEDSRMSFARMRHPDEDEADMASDFLGISLNDILTGGSTERVFGKPDIDNLQVLDIDSAVEKILNSFKSKKKSVKKKKK